MPPYRSGSLPRYAEAPVPDRHGEDPVGATLTWALGQLGRPLPVNLPARRAGMSRRTFDRRFQQVTGTVPASWLIHQRVLLAQRLLESTRLPVDEVARRCGFSCAAALRPHFRRLLGMAPAAYRGRFAGAA